MNISITAPSFFLSSSGLEKFLGNIPLSDLLESSIAFIALSIVKPFSSLFAFLAISLQRASGGTKNMFSEVYSSISSSNPAPSSTSS